MIRGTAAALASVVALDGEFIYATDTNVMKIGDGITGFSSLTTTVYRAGGTDVPITDGGTGASTAAGARTNLGLAGLAVLDRDWVAPFLLMGA